MRFREILIFSKRIAQLFPKTGIVQNRALLLTLFAQCEGPLVEVSLLVDIEKCIRNTRTLLKLARLLCTLWSV